MAILKKLIKFNKKTTKISNNTNAQKKINVMKAQGQLDYGIVFCGGGARGAFQIGVWKWLNDLGVANRFTGVSGASVGALNALLFAQGDYKEAVKTWKDMEKGDLVWWSKKTLTKKLKKILNKPIALPMAAIDILIYLKKILSTKN